MKGKRYPTEDKIRILREADPVEKSVLDICREANLSEVSFHRWQRQFGHMEVNEARRLKGLERENTELKKMLAEEMLKNRVLSYVCEKSCEPGCAPGLRTQGSGLGTLLATGGLPDSGLGALDVQLPGTTSDRSRRAIKAAAVGTVGGTSPF